MEAIKNVVTYTHNTYKKIVQYEFATSYKDEQGYEHTLKDVNGQPRDFKLQYSNSFTLNKSKANDRLLDEFLKDSPEVRANWTRIDLMQAEEKETEETLNSAQAVIEAAKMNVKDVTDFAKLAGINLNSNTDILRAKIIKMAQEDSEGFKNIHFDPEKSYRVFIYDALKSKHLSYKNATFMYGKEAIGTNEEQVIVWLKDNKDIFALIKHEHRGGDEVKQVKSKKEKV